MVVKSDMNRRGALRLGGALAAAAGSQGPALAQPAPAGATASTSSGSDSLRFFPGFRAGVAQIDGVPIYHVTGGSGPALLLLHGAPQSHIMWRRVAPALAEHFTVIAPDLRGYGRSGKPRSADYSKRRMADDQIALMQGLGFDRFRLVGHDRGARVARRLAKDHKQVVERLAILDIVPTAHLYGNVDRRVAAEFWHWFFLTHPAPIPEALMGPQAALFARATARAGQDADAGADYAATNGTPEAFHAMCEDYRAGAAADLAHDAADADVLIERPTLVMWGKQSSTMLFDMRAVWRNEARDPKFAEVDAGHFLAEERPAETLRRLMPFLRA